MEGLWSRRHRALTTGLILTITLAAFESLAISTILPIVARELGGVELYGWVFAAYFLGSLVGIVLTGGLIDRAGLIRPFVVALGLFGLGLAIGGVAPSMPFLVAGRLLQGLGGGGIAPVAYVAIGRSLPERLRPAMFAMLSTAWVLPGVLGPVVAATVAEQVSWRAVFIGLLPIIGLAGLLTLPALAAVPAATPVAPGSLPRARSARRLPQAVRVAVGAALLLAGLSEPLLILVVPLVAIGAWLALPAFARLAPAGTLRLVPGLPSAILLRGALTFAFFGAQAYVPLAFQGWRGLSASLTGIGLTAATLAWTGGAWVQARSIARLGAPRFVRLGFAAVVVGTIGTAAVLLPEMPIALAIGSMIVAAGGMGFAYAPLSLIVLKEAPPGEEGTATSGLQLSDTLGLALGTGVAGAMVAWAARLGAPSWVGLAGAFAAATVMGLLGLAASGRVAIPGRGTPGRLR